MNERTVKDEKALPLEAQRRIFLLFFFFFALHKAQRLDVLVNINNICLIPSNIYHGCLPLE